MSEDALQQIQDLIRYCPVCGEESTKNFEHYTAHSGEWICLACEEVIDVLLVDYEEEAQDESPAPLLPVVLLTLCLLGILYLFAT